VASAVWFVVVIAIVGYYATPLVLHARLDHFGLPHHVFYANDSSIYMHDSRAPFWAKAVLAGARPVAYMLFVKVLVHDLHLIVLAQTVLWIAACGACAMSLAAVVRSRAARAVAYVTVGLIAISAPLMEWTGSISNECLSLSLTMATFAAAVRLALAPTRRVAIVFSVLLGLLAFVRDTNAMIAVLIGIGAVVVLLARRDRRSLAGPIAVVALAAGGIALVLASIGARWYEPLLDVEVVRLQNDSTAAPYIHAHGFPDDVQVRRLGIALGFLDHSRQVFVSPQYAPLRDWTHRDGRSVYGRFLLTHPGWALDTAFKGRRDLITPDVSAYAIVMHVPLPAVSERARTFTLFDSLQNAEIGALLAGALLIVAAWRTGRRGGDRRRARAWLVLGFGTAGLWVVHSIAAFHGDAFEIPRHALSAALTLRLAMIAAIVGGIDLLVARASGEELPHLDDVDSEDDDLEPDRGGEQHIGAGLAVVEPEG
jgi:hypothetical protein